MNNKSAMTVRQLRDGRAHHEAVGRPSNSMISNKFADFPKILLLFKLYSKKTGEKMYQKSLHISSSSLAFASASSSSSTS